MPKPVTIATYCYTLCILGQKEPRVASSLLSLITVLQNLYCLSYLGLAPNILNLITITYTGLDHNCPYNVLALNQQCPGLCLKEQLTGFKAPVATTLEYQWEAAVKPPPS